MYTLLNIPTPVIRSDTIPMWKCEFYTWNADLFPRDCKLRAIWKCFGYRNTVLIKIGCLGLKKVLLLSLENNIMHFYVSMNSDKCFVSIGNVYQYFGYNLFGVFQLMFSRRFDVLSLNFNLTWLYQSSYYTTFKIDGGVGNSLFIRELYYRFWCGLLYHLENILWKV